MQITIEICTGADHRREVTKQDIQRNIDALQRMINGKPLASDFVLLLDTQSILEGIKTKLPSRFESNANFAELMRDQEIEARQERKRDRAEERHYRDEGERFETESGARP